MYLISKNNMDEYTLHLQFSFYINHKKNIEISAIFVISFVDILVKFNDTSNISIEVHKTKLQFCCLIVAPNQPKNRFGFKYLLNIHYYILYLKLFNDV